jgi:hypothetical protein
MTVCLDTGVSGYRPLPIAPDEFIRLHLATG